MTNESCAPSGESSKCARAKPATNGQASLDLRWTDVFPRWMAQDAYREAYFESPEDLILKLQAEFVEFVAGQLRDALVAPDVDEDTVIGVFGAASLYGFTRISEVLKHVEGDIRGRVLLFFPGYHDQNNYHLLDVRDGWNYLAVPITLHDGEGR